MIRVKVEIVPHGNEDRAEVLDTILIINDGTIQALGEDEGGFGNYEVHDGGSAAHLNNVDYPHMYASGFIKHVERNPDHRTFLAEQALGVALEARKLEKEGFFNKPHNVFERPTRDFKDAPNTTGHGSDGEGQ